jgi:uncharacterized membrane protein
MAMAGEGWQTGRRIAPPRFIAFVIVLIVATAATSVWPFDLKLGRSLLVGFDLASALFLISLYPLLGEKAERMRQRSKDNDANRVGLLAITGLVMLVILIAVFNELAGKSSVTTIALVIATLALAWLFSNVVYALHYAHLFYGDADGDEEDDKGLDFPDEDEPDYWDFIYFSFTLGMTFQTSDVSITARGMRRVAIGHCLAAFVFNLGVLAFTINVLGGS